MRFNPALVVSTGDDGDALRHRRTSTNLSWDAILREVPVGFSNGNSRRHSGATRGKVSPAWLTPE